MTALVLGDLKDGWSRWGPCSSDPGSSQRDESGKALVTASAQNGGPAPLVEGVGVSSVIRARLAGSLRSTQGREGIFCVCLLFHFLGDKVDTDLLALLLQVGEIPTQDGYVFQVHRAGFWLAETQSLQSLVTP